ncbi:MAG: epoxyqueuosine reductase [Thermoproteota archaeon]|nr:epoxyqueuosine reductase [Thermoproteota archaeon]
MKIEKDKDRLTSEVKAVATWAGARLVGIVPISVTDVSPKVFVGWNVQEYSMRATEVMSDAKSIVVMGYHVCDDILELAVRHGGHWVYPSYFPLAVLEETVGNYLERRGYKAIANPPLPQKQLAQLGGLGCYGKNSLIINPKYGPWIRLATVLTSADLIPDNPFTVDLCSECTDCIKACPVQALTPYRVDNRRCLVGIHLTDSQSFEKNDQWLQVEPKLSKNAHQMCTRCQKACRYGREEH